MLLNGPSVSVLGTDPAHRRCILNGNAFQQDAIVSCNGWQYAAFYSCLRPESDAAPEPLYVHLARRALPSGTWEVMALNDYAQTMDDGHNTVQLGICPGDGTIHLSYDHHCDILRYRYSVRNLARDPARFDWTPALFTPTLDYLPGLPSTHKHFHYVTYPRFGFVGNDMFCSFRDGKAGLGNDHLYLYRANAGVFSFVGTPLTGLQSNPYVHGIDHRNGRLHLTWVYRAFVYYPGWDDPLDTKHKQQAGPNSAANNHNICYAYSDDNGYTWRNGAADVIADLKQGGTITNDAPGIVAFDIPRGSGLMNQEAQAIDHDGGVHVLNRDTTDGDYLWKHYYRSPQGLWSQRPLQPIGEGSRRGRLVVSRDGHLYIILPDSVSATMRILKASKDTEYAAYEEVWVGSGLTGEPLVDSARVEYDNVLSLFALADGNDGPNKKNVVVVDFQL
ncbi:hypothetical protein B0T17DRAFT_492645 [Bombardia bombarda]|uniref:Dockerin type 1 n=1 Tax=Bombardia bombarda TaxID=252184 RepID=A0AA39WZK9_9PEZI|nr:hypothetical protein B0T17DRAFT_492645 [Bombardia bombarda]